MAAIMGTVTIIMMLMVTVQRSRNLTVPMPPTITGTNSTHHNELSRVPNRTVILRAAIGGRQVTLGQ
jgi:hypothetical protein